MHHLPAHRFGEPLEHRRIPHWLETLQFDSGGEPHALAGQTAVDDGGLGGARILTVQAERLPEPVAALVETDRHSAPRQPPALLGLQLAEHVPRPWQGGQRLLGRARVGIVSVRGDVQFEGRLGPLGQFHTRPGWIARRQPDLAAVDGFQTLHGLPAVVGGNVGHRRQRGVGRPSCRLVALTDTASGDSQLGLGAAIAGSACRAQDLLVLRSSRGVLLACKQGVTPTPAAVPLAVAN